MLQIALWLALEDNAAFRSPGCGFFAESAVHLVQFSGAAAVLYGTLLRDMGYRTRAATFLVWFSALGAAVAWLLPDHMPITGWAWLGAEPAAVREFAVISLLNLLMAFTGQRD